MSLRATPVHMCMAEAVPFGQRWTYHTAHPIEAVLDPTYFIPVRHMLKPGDDIRVCRVVSGRVRQLVDLLVVEKHERSVDLMKLREVTDIPTPDQPVRPSSIETIGGERYVTSDGKVKWNVGKRVYDVLDRDNVVAETADKAEAYRIAQGEIPIPETAAAA